MNPRTTLSVLFSSLFVLAVGCGDDTATTSASVEISAAAGGTVAVDGAELVIPAGALAADTTVTVSTTDAAGLAGSDNVIAKVFDFGPDGLEFLAPATLTLDFSAGDVAAGNSAVVAWHDGSAWVALASTVEGGQVSAPVTHFTAFTVIWMAGGGSTASCSDFEFTPCGGDLVGTWSYEGACLDTNGFNPFEDSGMDCPGASMSATIDVSGTVTFNGDGTFTVDQTATMETTITIPKSCLPPGMTCDQMNDEEDGEIYVDTGDACAMTSTETEEESDGGTWETAGNTLTTTDADGVEPSTPMDYCVAGDTARFVSVEESNGIEVFYTATRQ